jgi:hypothetical protein
MQEEHGSIRGMLTAVLLCLAIPSCGARKPDAERIKADLIGHSVGSPLGNYYEFRSPSAYVDFDIKSAAESGSTIEYAIGVVLDQAAGKVRCYATLQVVYRKEDSGWKFASVTDGRTLNCR